MKIEMDSLENCVKYSELKSGQCFVTDGDLWMKLRNGDRCVRLRDGELGAFYDDHYVYLRLDARVVCDDGFPEERPPYLTREEHVAATVLGGLLSDPHRSGNHEDYTLDAVGFAEALLAETERRRIERKKQGGGE